MIPTIEEFEKAVLNCPRVYKPTPFQIDWGKPKRQGKRVGNTIVGSMSNAPHGIKTYYNPFGELPDYNEIKDDIKFIRYSGAYIKARDYGLDHYTARMFSLNVNKAYSLVYGVSV